MRTLITISAMALAFASGWSYRNNSAELEINDMQLSQLRALNSALVTMVSIETKRKAALAENDKLFAQLKTEQARKNKTITKQVIRYVEKNSHSDTCQLPNKWVQLHDAAATNSMPTNTGTTGVSDDTTARLTATGALETITDNYQSCNDIRIQLLELQAWASEIIYEH